MTTNTNRTANPLPERYIKRDGRADYQRFIKNPQKPKPKAVTLLMGGWALANY